MNSGAYVGRSVSSVGPAFLSTDPGPPLRAVSGQRALRPRGHQSAHPLSVIEKR